MSMQGAWNHFRTITRHRHLVIRHCWKAGIFWQGLRHDLSKYSPTEFLPGARYYQGNRSPNEKEREVLGYSVAWMHHKGRNKHHFEYWIDFAINPRDGLVGMPMPTRYVLEMFCDRISASKNYNRDTYNDSFPLEYYNKNKDYYVLHPDTRALLEKLLTMLADEGEEATFKYIRENIDWKKSNKY